MKKLCLVAGLVVAGLSGPASAAVTVTFVPGATVIPTGFNVFQNFDALPAGISLGTNAIVYGANSAAAARPAFGSTGNFAGVGTGGSAAFSFAPTSAFGFTLGSLDTFNSITFQFQDGTTQTLTGGQVVNGAMANGDQVASQTNGFVYYTTTGPAIVGATFASSSVAFEFDNLSAAVPEPLTWAMMLLGFGAIGGALRGRKNSQTRIRFA